MQLNRLPEGGASFIPQQHTLGCAAFISFRYFRIVAPMSPKITSLATASNTNFRKEVRVAVRVQRGGLRCPPGQAGSGSPPNRGSRRTGPASQIFEPVGCRVVIPVLVPAITYFCWISKRGRPETDFVLHSRGSGSR